MPASVAPRAARAFASPKHDAPLEAEQLRAEVLARIRSSSEISDLRLVAKVTVRSWVAPLLGLLLQPRSSLSRSSRSEGSAERLLAALLQQYTQVLRALGSPVPR